MKKLVSCALFFMLVLSCNYVVFGFTDVGLEYVYTESINYMAEKGYISGYGDGTFKPEKYINFNEFSSVLVKASDNEDFKTFKVYDNSFWSKGYLDFIRIEGWLSYSDLNCEDYIKCQEMIPKDLVLKGIFNMAGVHLYNYRLYDIEGSDLNLCKDKDSQNAIIMGYILGLIEMKEDNTLGVSESVTRGEVCEWICKIKNLTDEDKLKLRPEIMDKFKIEYLEGQGERTQLFVWNELGDIPVEILEKFADLNWKMVITDKELMDICSYPDLDLGSAIGLCDPNKKVIYVSYDILLNIGSCIKHEMGHFVDFTYLDNYTNRTEIKKLFELEKENLSEFKYRDYCETNYREFFAEAFGSYMSYTTATERMKGLIYEAIPLTCEYLDNFVNNLNK